MTYEFALEYIPRRMKDLGYGDDYSMRLKHIHVVGGEVKTVDAYNQLIIIIDPSYDVRIESEMGFIDEGDFTPNEWQYEHQGLVTIWNKNYYTTYVKYIQVIPKNTDHASDQR